MEKIVRIHANPQEGYNFHGEAHRLWFRDGTTVTVLEEEDDPPMVEVEVADKSDPHNPAKLRKEMRPNPTVIGQRSFRALQANPRISIRSDGDSVSTASLGEIKAAKEYAQKLSGELADAKIEIAKRDGEIARLKDEVSSLQGKLTTAEAVIAAHGKKVPAKAPAPEKNAAA